VMWPHHLRWLDLHHSGGRMITNYLHDLSLDEYLSCLNLQDDHQWLTEISNIVPSLLATPRGAVISRGYSGMVEKFIKVHREQQTLELIRSDGH